MSDADPITTFRTLDEAESALDWIGLDFIEGEHTFEGELAGEDRELLEASLGDGETPGPVRDLARTLLERWDADGGDALTFVVRFGD